MVSMFGVLPYAVENVGSNHSQIASEKCHDDRHGCICPQESKTFLAELFIHESFSTPWGMGLN